MSTCETLPATIPVSPRASTLAGRIAAFWRGIVQGAAARRRAARRRWLRYTTELELAKLPPEVRKDIGWPTRQDY
jgi:hypothetical protein